MVAGECAPVVWCWLPMSEFVDYRGAECVLLCVCKCFSVSLCVFSRVVCAVFWKPEPTNTPVSVSLIKQNKTKQKHSFWHSLGICWQSEKNPVKLSPNFQNKRSRRGVICCNFFLSGHWLKPRPKQTNWSFCGVLLSSPSAWHSSAMWNTIHAEDLMK